MKARHKIAFFHLWFFQYKSLEGSDQSLYQEEYRSGYCLHDDLGKWEGVLKLNCILNGHRLNRYL